MLCTYYAVICWGWLRPNLDQRQRIQKSLCFKMFLICTCGCKLLIACWIIVNLAWWLIKNVCGMEIYHISIHYFNGYLFWCSYCTQILQYIGIFHKENIPLNKLHCCFCMLNCVNVVVFLVTTLWKVLVVLKWFPKRFIDVARQGWHIPSIVLQFIPSN